jgi:hypothetical protein
MDAQANPIPAADFQNPTDSTARRRRGRALIDLVGRRFGRLLVVAIHPERKSYGRQRRAVAVSWLCRCDCGAERVVFGSNLRQGFSRSCGCFNREQTIKRSTKHGYARRGQVASIYSRWSSMKQRCFNSNNKSYPDYGGRGISTCEPWREFFIGFHADVGDPPPGKSLDRKNVNGNYEKENVRWATSSQQQRNKRKKRRRADVADIQAFAARMASASGRQPEAAR